MTGKQKSATAILNLLAALSMLLIAPDALADRGGDRR